MAGGRPPIYDNVEQLQYKIDEYFEYIQGDYNEVEDEETGGMKRIYERYPEPATITGLCLFLGFESRQSFYDYSKQSQFSYTIKKARLRVEFEYEKSLSNPRVPTTGAIFALKNLGWSDKQEIDHTTNGESIPAVTVFQLPDNGRD